MLNITNYCWCYPVPKSHLTRQPHGLQHARLPVFHYLLEFAQIHGRWVCDAVWSSHPLSPSSPFAFNFSQDQGLFQRVGLSHQVAKVLELQLQHQSLISFRIYWFDLLVVLGTLKSLLQYHNSKASILQHSAFFMVQLLISIHDYWKNHSYDYMDLRQQSDKGHSAF